MAGGYTGVGHTAVGVVHEGESLWKCTCGGAVMFRGQEQVSHWTAEEFEEALKE